MAETSTIPDADLWFRRDETRVSVPLTGVSIDAEISGLCVRVSVAHRYTNREITPIEAVYVFPLDEGAAVCGFEAVVDGTLVVGEVKSRDEAFDAYDEALEQGHGGFLLDEERPDVFQASVGNLAPGKEVLVRLTYITELSINGGRLRFVIPTTVSPRYAPQTDRSAVGRSDAETLNPPVAWSVPYGLDLSVHLAMPGRITGVESSSHPISVTLNEREARVKLAQERTALDRDFVLSIDAVGMDAPQAWIERDDDGTDAVAVAFGPTFPETASPAEIIFLVDRSGSMAGTSIDEVRNALQLCLRSMTAGCRFNIVGFGSTYESLFPESRHYEQASLEAASSRIGRMDADLGGTEILPALKFVFEQPRQPELPRQVVVLTDGEVTNTDAVLALAAAHATEARIFTLGIGAGASHHLVRGLARAGGGSPEFIFPGERIEPKVVRLFGRLLSPALTDVKVDWVGADVTQAPAKVPPIFASSRLLVYGFCRGARPTAVRLSANSRSAPLTFEVPLDAADMTAGRIVAPLAARARIRELEESRDWLGTRGSRQRDKKRSRASQEIVELSLRYGIISRETSFVAIERRDTPVTSDMQLRRVPIALTSGWGAAEDLAQNLHSVRARYAQSMDMRVPFVDSDYLMRHMERATLHEAAFVDAPARLHHQPREITPRPPEMDALVALQQADGSWELTGELAALLKRDPREIDAALAGAAGNTLSVRRAWATALALAWLQLRAADQQDEWKLLGAKARKWIDDVDAVPPGGWTWLDAARRFLKRSA